MSTKYHPKRGLLVDKSVHKMSPKVSTRCHLFCPWDVTYYVHEMSATHITLIGTMKMRTPKNVMQICLIYFHDEISTVIEDFSL